jgi:hypothetical protein
MENILYNISQVLGITIIHSLWQGLLIYFLLRVVLLSASGLTASKKITAGGEQPFGNYRLVCLHADTRNTTV